MAFQVERKQDGQVVRAFSHKLADIPNGASIKSSELAGSILYEGTVVGKGTDAHLHVIKTAKLAASATNSAVTYTVNKGHHFKVGDFIMLRTGAKAYAIASIATNATDATLDDITVGTTLGAAASKGDAIIQARAESSGTASAFAFTPVGLVSESYQISGTNYTNPNIWVDVVTIGQVKEAVIPAINGGLKDALKGVIFI